MRMYKSICEACVLLTGYSVWSQIIDNLRNIRSIFSANEVLSAGLQKFTLKLIESATEKIGWEFAPNEDYLTGQLRALLISTAGAAGHQGLACTKTGKIHKLMRPYQDH